MSLNLSSKRPIGRCPQCRELIDVSALRCRFCGTGFAPEEAEKLRALQDQADQRMAQKNNTRSLLSALVDIVKGVARGILHGRWG
jgi:hypothetical protein